MSTLKHACIFVAAITFGAASFVKAEQSSGPSLSDARRALMQGRLAEAVPMLQRFAAAGTQAGQAHLLLCRAYYAERAADSAVHECEAALATMSKSSEAQDWMGKAYGMKAEHANLLSGYGLAKKVKASFEAAVALDPTSVEAIDDLGDYYIQAPSIVGGGLDKAKALAEHVQSRDKTAALRLQAAIAEKEKDYGSAERDLKEHVQVTNGRPDTWFDLASFYKRRNQNDAAIDALNHAKENVHDKGPILVGIAEMLNELERQPAPAMAILQNYLSGGNTDLSAPPFRVHLLLGKMHAAQGDKAAAKIEFTKCLTLAPDYEPAKKALASL